MLRIGLTGGIGAGKSEVATRLAGHGAVVIDADQLARAVIAPGTDGFAELTAAFGDGLVDEHGALDRAALAERVFADEAARRTLEGIIHPRVRARTAELTAAAAPDAIVVNDVPLLVETGLAATYHLVIVVAAAEPTRVVRLTRHRGMAEAHARARIRSQASDEQRRLAADVVFRNDADLAELHGAVDAVWRDRLVPYEENLRLRRAAPVGEQLSVRPYDPTWPEQFARLAGRIRRVAGELPVHHIGSTAVPGLAAKDVIDVQLTVPDLAAADALADQLAEAGFPPLPGDWVDTPKPDAPQESAWRKRVHGSADPGRMVNLHVRPAGSPGQRLSLLLRDWLRADPAARDEYAERKRVLAGAHRRTSEYSAAKEPWFTEVWSRAQQWAAQSGWQPPAQ